MEYTLIMAIRLSEINENLSSSIVPGVLMLLTGFRRCPFQKRMPVMLPNQEIFVSKKPDYYKPEDFYIGARLNLNDFIFEITTADVYALRYMELHCDKVQ